MTEQPSSTWEERMAARAAVRRAARLDMDKSRRLAEEEALRPIVAARNEAAILAEVERLRYSDVPASTEEQPACACVGPPTGCSLCFCHIHEEALAVIEQRSCRWQSCQPSSP